VAGRRPQALAPLLVGLQAATVAPHVAAPSSPASHIIRSGAEPRITGQLDGDIIIEH